jgi:hypothetical protein
MRLPNLSPAVDRQISTGAGLLDRKVSSSSCVGIGCTMDVDCPQACPNCEGGLCRE